MLRKPSISSMTKLTSLPITLKDCLTSSTTRAISKWACATTVQIVADDDTDIKHLIGRNGEVVDALQQLTRLAVQQKTGERSHLIVDVDGYLKRKRQRLHDLALDAIDEARETGEPVDLKPMNSFERKIIHDVVREEGMKSRSHGEEPHRYVTVYVKASAVDDADEIDEA